MPNRFNPDVPPAWHAIKLDETGHYDKEFLEKYGVGKIYGVYIADFSSRTYCCEITPSYALYFINSVAEYPDYDDDDKRVEFLDELDECDGYTEPVVYFHCHTIKALPDDRKYPIHIQEDDWRDDPEGSGYEVAREECQGNPVW